MNPTESPAIRARGVFYWPGAEKRLNTALRLHVIYCLGEAFAFSKTRVWVFAPLWTLLTGGDWVRQALQNRASPQGTEMAEFNYVSHAQRATTVTHALVGAFTGNADMNLVLGHCTRLDGGLRDTLVLV